jgi:hypothetical protein
MIPSIISQIESIQPAVYKVTVMVEGKKDPFFYHEYKYSAIAEFHYRMWSKRIIFGIPPLQQVTLSCTQDGVTETLETYVPTEIS